MRKVCLIVMLLMGLAVTALPSLAQDSVVVGGDEASLRKMVERLVLRYGYGGPDDHAHAFIGQLPPDMPYTLPLPEDAALIGSVVTQASYGGDEVYFDTNLTPDEVFDFYANNLDDPFSQPEAFQSYAPGGGFGTADYPVSQIYCYNGAEAALTLMADDDMGITQVTAMIMAPALMDVCHGITPAEMGMSGAFKYLPTLSTPPGVQLRMDRGGGGGSSYTATSAALLISEEMNAADLLAFFTKDVEAAGWVIDQSSGDDTSIGWLTAIYTDENGDVWGCYMTIVPDATAPNQFNAYINVYSASF